MEDEKNSIGKVLSEENGADNNLNNLKEDEALSVEDALLPSSEVAADKATQTDNALLATTETEREEVTEAVLATTETAREEVTEAVPPTVQSDSGVFPELTYEAEGEETIAENSELSVTSPTQADNAVNRDCADNLTTAACATGEETPTAQAINSAQEASDGYAESRESPAEQSAQEDGEHVISQIPKGENTDTANAQSEEKKAPKKKRSLSHKQKKVLIILLILAVLIGSVASGHFLATKDLIFIHTVDDLYNIGDTEGKILLIKTDLTVENLTLVGCSVDINHNTLTVTDTLTIDCGKQDEITVGYMTIQGWYKEGGTINAKNVIYNCEGASLRLLSHYYADSISVTCKKLEMGETEVLGAQNPTTEVELMQVETALVSSNIVGSLSLNNSATLDFYGTCEKISGGLLINVQNGAQVQEVDGAIELMVFPQGNVETISNVALPYFVEYLEAPQLLVLLENNRFICYISEVPHADYFTYTIGDKEGITREDFFVLPTDLPPDKYELTVVAHSDTKGFISDLAESVIKVTYTVQLDTPDVTVQKRTEEDGEHIIVFISPVPNATHYTCEVADEKIKVEAATLFKTEIDITEYLAQVGVCVVYVTAENEENKSYSDSYPNQASFIRTEPLNMTALTSRIKGETIEISWTAANNAQYYVVTNGRETVYTKAVSCSIPYEIGDTVSVYALGYGYYTDSPAVVAVVN